MDDKDRQIVAELQADARLTNSELAERVHLSPSPCLRRVRLLEEAGVLKGYTAIVDAEACGYPVTAFVRIRIQPHNGKPSGPSRRRSPGSTLSWTATSWPATRTTCCAWW